MATAAAQAGDLDRAEALARTIPGPVAQAEALTAVATAAAQAGDLDRAEALARTIPGPVAQAKALTAVATAAAQAGDPGRAAGLLATVLVAEVPEVSWMATVSRFFPSAMGDAWDILAGTYMTQA